MITGGSAGIGLSTAERFSQEGFIVVNLSRRPCPLDAVEHIPCDLSNPGFMVEIEPQLNPFLDKADQLVLVHNAARMNNDHVAETGSEAFRAVLEVNLVAPNSLNHHLLSYMKPGSSVIYVGSTLSEKAVPGSYSYVTTKHAMVGMMRATCQDLAGRDIHTACICPGFTDTDMLRQHLPDDAVDVAQAMSAFNRLIHPEEIAETIFWAAGNPVINGAVLHANLGQVES